MARLKLPRLDEQATEAAEAKREANTETLRSLHERIEAARERRRAASRRLADNPYRTCPNRPKHRSTERERRNLSSTVASIDRDLAAARKDASKRAHRILRSLRSVLESFGYMAEGQPTAKAETIKHLFDSNSLTISELLDWGVIADASPFEIAEVASWFAFDREGSGRPLALTERLTQIPGSSGSHFEKGARNRAPFRSQSLLAAVLRVQGCWARLDDRLYPGGPERPVRPARGRPRVRAAEDNRPVQADQASRPALEKPRTRKAGGRGRTAPPARGCGQLLPVDCRGTGLRIRFTASPILGRGAGKTVAAATLAAATSLVPPRGFEPLISTLKG